VVAAALALDVRENKPSGTGRRVPALPAALGPVTSLPQLVDLLLRKINILQRDVKEFSVNVGDPT
jgi:hypothetical protein